MEIQWTVMCPLPGLEQVAVTYNLMVSEAELNAAQESLSAGNLVAEVQNWPPDLGEPFGPEAPLAFRMWAVHKGIRAAAREFLTDPN